MTECGCHAWMHQEQQQAGVVHCPRHSEAHVAQVETELAQRRHDDAEIAA